MTNASLSRRPFYVHIATLFILLFSLLGGALIVLQFQQGMQQGLEHERQSFQQYREQLALAIKLNQRPARMSLNLLRSGQLSAMTGLETRLAFLPQLAEVLANSTSYGAIYAGYEDGDFFLVRKLTERARGALEAPHAGLPFRSARSGLVQGGALEHGHHSDPPLPLLHYPGARHDTGGGER